MENFYYKNNSLTLYYKNQSFQSRLPESSFNKQLLYKLFSPEILSKVITGVNAYKLKQLLPKSESDIINDPQKLSNLLLNTITKFNTPINDFYQKYLHNFFSYNYQSKLGLFNM